MPNRDDKSMKDVLDFVANLNLSTITDQFSHGSPITDVILKGVDELLVGFNSIYIHDVGLGANKKDSSCGAIVYSGNISIDNITGNRFIAAGNIEGRVGRSKSQIDEGSTHR